MTKSRTSMWAGAACAALATAWTPCAGAVPAANHGVGFTGAIPYDGRNDDALAASGAGSTIPLARKSFTATKDKMTYTDVVVGQSPFAKTKKTTTIDVLIVPVIVDIGSTTFDPTVPDSCIATDVAPLTAFQQSPILAKVAFDGKTGHAHGALMNGVDVGTTTYPDAVRRAEFWTLVGGTKYHTAFKISTASTFTITASEVTALGGGKVLTTSCAPLGVLPLKAFQKYIAKTVLKSVAGVTPTTFVLFLMKDVVTTTSKSLTCVDGCEIGYHAALGKPVQTYGVAEYDTTAGFWNSPGIKDISILAHEVGEWLDDPLVTNPTPPWGGIGQVSGCQDNWEVGDPLTGTDFPAITMPNGITYDPQELAFWSWFYNARGAASFGTGGKFSSNGTFAGPSKVCPPGGTY